MKEDERYRPKFCKICRIGECFIGVRGWAPLQYVRVVHRVQRSLVSTFELRPTIAARGYKIIPCAARGVKKVNGQH